MLLACVYFIGWGVENKGLLSGGEDYGRGAIFCGPPSVVEGGNVFVAWRALTSIFPTRRDAFLSDYAITPPALPKRVKNFTLLFSWLAL